jgi:hypothetical protein
MQKYYFVHNTTFSDDKSKVQSIQLSWTDGLNRTIFTPPQNITRNEAITLLKNGDILFMFDGCYHRIFIKLLIIDNQEFLRVDNFSHPFDYFG